MKKIILTAVSICLFIPAFGLENIGSIKKAEGDVSILRAQKKTAASAGMHLAEGDVILSGRDGSAGLILKDGTTLSVGPDTEIIMSRFLFEPKDSKYAMSMRMNKGTAVYESGRMAKLAPKSVSITTPKATIGVRGTKFMIKVD